MMIGRRFATVRAIGLAMTCSILAAAAAAAPTAATAAPLTRIDVYPGPNALTNALAQAQPGDKLVLHAGTYPETVTISTANITVEPAGDGIVTVDGGCSSVATIDVRADGVKLRGPISVVGGQFYELNYLDQTSGSVTGFTLTDTCHGSFGLFLQGTGAVSVTSLTVSGFAGGGIELFSVTANGDSGRALVARNDIFGTGEGILVESSGGGNIQILDNRVHHATFYGIDLKDSEGVLVRGNSTLNDGTNGIVLDAESVQNRVIDNVAKGNTFDLENDGFSNCFKRNRFHTSEGDVGC